MSSTERFALKVTTDLIDDVLNGLKKLGGTVVGVSYTNNEFIVIYTADKKIDLDDCLISMKK